MNLYNEDTLFEYLRLNHYPDLERSDDRMSRWDCYSLVTQHRIELKCRSKHFSGLIIEKKKYDALMDKCKDNDDRPIYINSTPEGIYRFDLYTVEPEWRELMLRKTTHFNEANKIPKEIAFLEVIDAEVL